MAFYSPAVTQGMASKWCRFSYLVGWALSSSQSYISLDDWKSMLVYQHITLPQPLGTIFVSPLGKNQGIWGKRVTDATERDHLVHVILSSSSAPVAFVGIHKEYLFLHFLCIQRNRSIHIFPRSPCHQSSDQVPSKFLTIQLNHCTLSMSLCRFVLRAIFFLWAKGTFTFTAQRLPTEEIIFYYCPQGHPRVKL